MGHGGNHKIGKDHQKVSRPPRPSSHFHPQSAAGYCCCCPSDGDHSFSCSFHYILGGTTIIAGMYDYSYCHTTTRSRQQQGGRNATSRRTQLRKLKQDDEEEATVEPTAVVSAAPVPTNDDKTSWCNATSGGDDDDNAVFGFAGLYRRYDKQRQ